MDKSILQNKITELLPEIIVKFWEPMSKHTSFRIGGPAEVMAFPKDSHEVSRLINMSKLLDCNFSIIGAGTNILAPDSGISGIVMCLKDGLNGIQQIDDTHIRAYSGATMSRLAVFASDVNLSGLEFAHGIPGSVGGGVYMNAGAYGGEICQVCESAEVMLEDGTIENWSNERIGFSYRHSRMESENAIVLSAVFKLFPSSKTEIRTKMTELMEKRKKSQPLDKPSAGSAFKRPKGGYAAALIEKSGLKGFRIGDAAVSEKHAGFAVNLGSASSHDMQELLKTVSDKVFLDSGIRLEPEIRIW